MNLSRKNSFWIRVSKGIDWINQYGVMVIGLFLLVATCLWMIALDGPWYIRLPKAISHALLNRIVDKNISPLIQFGLFVTQIFIPVFASGTIFAKLFHEQIHPFIKRKKVNSYTNHHIIISYGAFGQALAKALSEPVKNHNTPNHIVAIDKRNILQYNDLKPTILFYDALQSDISKEANLQFANSIYLMLPDERDNLTLLKKIEEIEAQKSHLKIYLRTHSFEMHRLLMDWVGIGLLKKNIMDIRASNPYTVAARGILNRYSPDLYAPTNKSASVSQTVMIIGTSTMAKELVLRFARIGIYSPKGKLKLIWVGKGVSDALKELTSNYPALDTDYGEIGYWSSEQEKSEKYFNSVLPPIHIIIDDMPIIEAMRNKKIAANDSSSWPSVIYICHNSDVQNLAEARDLQANLCAKTEAASLKTNPQRLILAIQSKSIFKMGDQEELTVLPYRIEEQCIDELFAKTVVEDRADDLAKEFHAVYVNRKHQETNKIWADLPLFLKESNRDLADHLAIKARYAGIDADTVKNVVFDGYGAISEADQKLMEIAYTELVHMEVRRYRAFMFMNGFTHGSHPSEYTKRINKSQHRPDLEKQFDRCLRLNATLLEEILPQYEKEKDYAIIKHSMKALKMRTLSLSIDDRKQ